jgi:hypothetical protein
VLADIPQLTAALRGLEDRFRAQNAPVAHLLRPGLSDNQIDALTAELPFRFSDELRCLYRWHDGADETDDDTGEHAFVPGMDVIAPLAQAVQEYHRWIEAPSIPQEPYSPTWFPINLGRTIIVVESGVAAGTAGALHSLDTHSEWLYDRAPSLLHAVRLWNKMLDDGYWIYDEFEHDWEDHYLDIPEELRATGLV